MKCSVCGLSHPNPPHTLEPVPWFDLDLKLCPRCLSMLKRTSLELLNRIRGIFGQEDKLKYTENSWRGEQ